MGHHPPANRPVMRAHPAAVRCMQLALPVLGLFAVSSGAFANGSAQPEATTQLPAAPTNGELGFVLTAFAPAIYQGKGDCPEGLANTVRENYLQSLPPAERARLLQPTNEQELTQRWKAYAVGPNNTNICANAEMFDRPMQKTIQGKVAYGLNLDGDGSGASDGCAHENFTSPDGETGIDNQAYRAMGCTRNYRGVDGVAGDIVKGYNNFLATGEHTLVLLLRRVESLTNDDDVEVIFATTDDRPTLDSKQNFIPGASFTVSDNPRWRNVLRGHIADGVLSTEPADIRVTRRFGIGGVRGERLEWDLRRSRFRLVFQQDGSVKGLLGAYQPYDQVTKMTRTGGIGAALVAGIDCAAELGTLKKLADGLRDPKTGQCTAVSTALDIAAVPAFVFDRPPVGPATTAAAK